MATLLAAATALAQATPPDLPVALANNAVASGTVRGRLTVYSLLGIDSTKRWSGITKRAWQWVEGRTTWTEIAPVPGEAGRIGATAQVVRDRLVLVGGYTVAPDGKERSIAAVDIFDPATGQWHSGAPTPVAVDDAVSGVYRDSLLYLLSGWHDTTTVSLVQIYDAAKNRWVEGSPFPGTAVFGHTGAFVGNAILVVDGAKRVGGPVRYALERQSWLGLIDDHDPTRIAWSRLQDHPGPPRYRAAAAGCGRKTIVVVGGTANPYNYDGTGYDGVPSVPEAGGFALDVETRGWRVLSAAPEPTMDHRGLVMIRGQGFVIAGMRSQQQISTTTVKYPLPTC